MQRRACAADAVSLKAVRMVIKQILEGARRFKPAPTVQPVQRQHGLRRWAEWARWVLSRKDKYLIGIHPRRLPRG
jgi:hypothetical protein